MNKRVFRSLMLALFSLVLALSSASPAFGAATITINNVNAAGVGFNDATPAAPVGGNPGTTLGAQRLFAFTYAANIWGATLTSSVPIVINAQMTPLACTSTGATLGSAGAVTSFRDFAGAPFAGTWYSVALGNKLFGSDLNTSVADINANFNSNLGNVGCLDGTFFYLGVDGNHGANIDFVEVLLHEMAHGLGFATITNASTGALNGGFPSVYDRFLMDGTSGKSWLQMTNAERAASALNSHKLAWDGPLVQADVPSVLAIGIPLLTINSPAGLAGNYDAGGASFGPQPTAGGVTANFLLANDGVGTVTDGCEAFPVGFFTGQIAVIDRGTCSFKTKTLNAQNANAVGVIIVNNAAGTPAPALGDDATIVTPITIPTVSVTLSDGNLIKAQLPAPGVNGTILLDTSVRSGADKFGKALLFSPNPFQGGSSVSHWDTIAFPNQLMEPNINGDLTQNVLPPQDLTFSQLRDIGWVANALPNAIAKTTGDNQNAALNQPFPVPFSVTVSPAVNGLTITWTVNPGGSGQSAAFPSTSSRFAVSTTNALGVATAPPLTANGQPGVYSMNATVPGAGTTTFSLSNDPVPLAGSSCLTDTTQADFQAGVANNTDVTTSPGSVLLASSSVDQQNLNVTNSGFGIDAVNWAGQSFTPAVSGDLTRVDLDLFCSGCSGANPNLTVSIRATSGNLPTGADLATATIAGFSSGVASYKTANFASPPSLTAGTRYAVIIRPVSNRTGVYAYVVSAADAYANGQELEDGGDSGTTWTASGVDMGFITYMKSGSGDFTSSLKDSNPPFLNTFWSTMTWNATVPANTTLQFQVAGSNSFAGPFNFVGPDGTAATFYTTSPADITQFFGRRYLKYKAYFTTTNLAVTPTLNDVTVCFNNPPTAAEVSLSGRVLRSDGAPLAGVTVGLSGAASRTTITNGSGSYRFNGLDAGGFYTVAPEFANYHFSPANRSFSLIGDKTDAVFTAEPDATATANAIDTNEYFVRQQYLDFLGRDPEPDGLAFWTGKLNACNGDAACLRTRRIDVSAAFFQSQEFYDTGSFVYRLYRGALGRRLSFGEFAADRSQVVGGPNLEASKRAFAAEFVARSEFAQRYPAGSNAESFVDALLQTMQQETGVDLNSQRANLVARYQDGSTMNESRALVVRDLIDQQAFAQAVYNASFVEMEYMGYLRRGGERTGYEFWLNVLNNSDPGNYRGMVCSFITATEYQHRFGSLITHSNADCGNQ